MSGKPLRVNDYLDHILQAIRRVQRYTKDVSEVDFLNNEQMQDAVIRYEKSADSWLFRDQSGSGLENCTNFVARA